MGATCHILADGRMLVADGTAAPVAHEFAGLPRIGEKIVILATRSLPNSPKRSAVSSQPGSRAPASSDKTSQYHYRLGLNQPAGSPTVRRITEMAQARG
jgi:hypothetical protein